MGLVLRGMVLLAAAGGGVWGAYRLLDYLVRTTGLGSQFRMEDGGVLLMLPVGVVGALAGAFMGGFLLPRPR